MTTTLDLDPVREAVLIAAQNDAFRRSILGNTPVADAPQGQFVMTSGVAALGPDAQLELTRCVAAFNGFKVDLYDVDYANGSPEPSDPEQTRRVLTLLLPSEY